MSDIEQPRDDAGRFAGEEKFGRAAELEAAGYTEMPDAPQDDAKVYGGEEDDIRAAANEMATSRDDGELDAIEYRENGGEGDLIDEKQAITLERAARDLSAFHGNTNRYVDGASFEAIADIVDSARADLVKGDSNVAAAYGLNADEVAENAKAVEQKATAEPATDEQPAADAPIDGLDPEVQKALKHPQVRQAIEDELGKAETAKQQYAQALTAVSHLANHELLSIVPALQQIPQDQWLHALNVLREVEPETFVRARAVIERGAQAEMLQLQNARNQQIQQRQQFETYAKAEDTRFEELTKDAPVTKEVSDAVVKYAEGLGVDRASLTHLLATNPVMRNAAFQRMMVDAARYHMIKASTEGGAEKPASSPAPRRKAGESPGRLSRPWSAQRKAFCIRPYR